MTTSTVRILIILIRSEKFEVFKKLRTAEISSMVNIFGREINAVGPLKEDTYTPILEKILELFHHVTCAVNLLENCAVTEGMYMIFKLIRAPLLSIILSTYRRIHGTWKLGAQS